MENTLLLASYRRVFAKFLTFFGSTDNAATSTFGQSLTFHPDIILTHSLFQDSDTEMDAACGDEDWLSVPPTHGLICSSNKVKEVDSKRGRSNSSTKEADSKRRQIEEKPSLPGNKMIVVPAPTVDIPEPNRRESMAINSINQTIKTLDLKLVDKKLQKGKFYLRDASLSDWEAFVTSEDQQLKSKNMEWIDGKIFIVELPSEQHETYVQELSAVLRAATHTETTFLKISGAAYQTNVRRLEPDLCLLPRRVLGQPPYNVQLPPGVDWGNFQTVKWEVGWSQHWDDIGGLDWKANQWATVGTVVYIICIKLERPNLVDCSYKVHHVVHHGVNLPAIVPIPIAAPNTVIHLDSRLVLQLPAISPLPPNFPPQLDIDLFAPLAVLLADLPPAPAAI